MTFEDRLEIRRHYAFYRKEIMSDYRMALDPWRFPWLEFQTPIEKAAQYSLRLAGVHFYQEFPIGKYFADFANPVTKFVLECDGRKWHSNPEKDRIRQGEIERMGYRVWRVEGRDCFDGEEGSVMDQIAREIAQRQDEYAQPLINEEDFLSWPEILKKTLEKITENTERKIARYGNAA